MEENELVTIPKIVHMIQLGNPNLTKEQKERLHWVKRINPDYQVIVWTNRYLYKIKGHPYFPQKIFFKLLNEKNYAFASDILRFFLLYEYGGVYIDTDVEAVRPIPSEWLDKELVVDYECENGVIGSAIMLSKQYNPIMLDCLKYYANFKGKKLPTSPTILTDVVECSNEKNMLILEDPMVFYPLYPCEDEAYIAENTVFCHLFAGCWCGTGVKQSAFDMIDDNIYNLRKELYK